MASKRLITADTFEDEFFLSLSHFGRILWIGLIVRCADDQGRLQDNSILIKSQVFPADNLLPDQIEDALAQFANEGRILRYVSKGKKAIQILNWWKHQSPSWAAESRYPAPDGWIDRIKVHGKGTSVYTLNWDKPGGYCIPNDIPNGLGNGLGKGINDVKSEVNGKGEGSAKKHGFPPAGDDEAIGTPLSVEFTKITGILPHDNEKWVEADQTMTRAGITPEELAVALQKMDADALSYSGLWSVTKTAIWVHSRRQAGKPIFPTPQPKKNSMYGDGTGLLNGV